jgi:hypothetical protein
MRKIRDFDGLEIAPCRIVGNDSLGNELVEPCGDAPDEAVFWTVYGHFRTGGVTPLRTSPPKRRPSLSMTG